MNDSEITQAILDAALTVLEQCDINYSMLDEAAIRMKSRGCPDLIAYKAVSTVAQTLNQVHGTNHKSPNLRVIN